MDYCQHQTRIRRNSILLKNISELDFKADAISNAVKDFTKTKNIKIVAIAQPLRIALIGKSSGPGVFDLMAVLGKHETVARIEKLIEFIKSR